MLQWEMVDEGWGRRAVDFAALCEPANCREYVALHQRLAVGAGDRLLDVACGSGLAIELAAIRGAICAGIDASERLVAVARDRNPDSDIRVGDMQSLPWGDQSFDIVTSFRGIWGTTPAAVDEVHRVLVPGGRFVMTVWGDVKKSPGGWMFTPFRWATDAKIQHQADMVALGRPAPGQPCGPARVRTGQARRGTCFWPGWRFGAMPFMRRVSSASLYCTPIR